MLRGILHQATEDFPPVHTVQGYARSVPAGGTYARTHETHAKSTSVKHQESFLHTPTHDGGEEGGEGGLVGDAGRRSVQHCIQLVCQVVKHAADVVQDGHCRLLTGKRNVTIGLH